MFVSASEGEKKKKSSAEDKRAGLTGFSFSEDPGVTMCPLLLLFLLPGALNSATSSEDSTGLKFTVVFPENIAFYHPDRPQNRVQITALYDDTEVSIKTSEQLVTTENLSSGETRQFTAGAKLELLRGKFFNRSLQITSNKVITVHAVYLKDNSVQTTLVTPADKLGTEYLIPPVPRIEGTTQSADSVTTAVTERGPFKLIIINTDQTNNIIVKGAVENNVVLQPHSIAQILVEEEAGLRAVKAEQPVAILFGHTCAMRHNCTCGQLYAALPPATTETLKFYVPPVLAKDAEDETFILLSEKEATQVIPFNPKSPLVETSGTVILYRPGLLLPLIPETDFAACSVVNSIPNAQNFAMIVVHRDFTDGVHIGNRPLESPEWQRLRGTQYVSTSVLLESDKNVIWHSSSRMAVYFVGDKDGAVFGNPAPIISKTPDFRGCILSPEVVRVGEVAGGWRESLKYCTDNNLELVSLPNAQLQRHIYDKIIQAKNDNLQDVWIGLRRRSKTGEWYWLSGHPVTDLNWAKGEPGAVQDGQCAIMSLKSSKDFRWSDENCCKDAHPVCYSSPVFLPM